MNTEVAAALIAAGPATIAALAAWRQSRRIHHEVVENSGSSLKDGVNRIEGKVDALTDAVEGVQRRQVLIAERIYPDGYPAGFWN